MGEDREGRKGGRERNIRDKGTRGEEERFQSIWEN